MDKILIKVFFLSEVKIQKKKIIFNYTMSAQTSQSAGRISMPSNDTLSQAAKLSIKVSKPICFYFYIDSCKGDAQIVTADGDKIIYKNNEEHTSPIRHTYKVGTEYLIVTDNTIYIISCNTKVSK